MPESVADEVSDLLSLLRRPGIEGVGEASDAVGVGATTVDERRDSRLRTAGFMDDSRPVLTREVRYSWKATSERRRGEVGSYQTARILLVTCITDSEREINTQIHTSFPIL